MITFSSVIQFNFQHYVFLAEINGTTYLAKILDDEISKKCIELKGNRENSAQSGGLNAQLMLKENPLFCFVVLTTKEFHGRVAHTVNHNQDATQISRITEICRLNEEDATNLINEIVGGKQYAIELQDELKKLLPINL